MRELGLQMQAMYLTFHMDSGSWSQDISLAQETSFWKEERGEEWRGREERGEDGRRGSVNKEGNIILNHWIERAHAFDFTILFSVLRTGSPSEQHPSSKTTFPRSVASPVTTKLTCPALPRLCVPTLASSGPSTLISRLAVSRACHEMYLLIFLVLI